MERVHAHLAGRRGRVAGGRSSDGEGSGGRGGAGVACEKAGGFLAHYAHGARSLAVHGSCNGRAWQGDGFGATNNGSELLKSLFKPENSQFKGN